jgi:MFS family permease
MSHSASGLRVLRNRNYALYLFARVFGSLAVQMQSVAVGWQVYQITGDVFDLGLIGLAQFAPFLVLILFAGHAADIWNRKHIITACLGVQLLVALLLLAFTLAGARTVWPVFAVLVLFGSARAFMMPASQAVLRNMVPTADFSQAVALSSSAFHVAVIAGPTLGGLLYLAGPKAVYALAAFLLLVSTAAMALTRNAPQARSTEPFKLATLLEGIRFVRSRPVMLGAISLDLFAVLFGGATALLPAYAHDVLQAGPTGLGLLRTMPAAGSAVCSMVLAWRPLRRHVGAWMFAGVGVFGLATIVLGLSASFPLALGCLFILGAGDMISVYVRHLLVQFETPDEIRGRVSAVSAVFIGASNELGEFESGLTAGWFGLLRAIVLGGIATMAVTGLWAWRFPVLSTMDRFPHHEQDSP